MSTPYQSLDADDWAYFYSVGSVYRAAGHLLNRPPSHHFSASVNRAVIDAVQVIPPGLAPQAALDHAQRATATCLEAQRSLYASDDETVAHADGLLHHCSNLASDDPFATMFSVLLREARSVYDNWALEVSLDIGKLVPNHASTAPYRITATTTHTVAPHGPPATATVRLGLPMVPFNPADFAVIPLALAHELVCHVFGHQVTIDNTSPFSEGLMDWTSQYFADGWLDHLPTTSGQHTRAQVTDYRHHQRSRAERRLGWEAGESLVSWLRTELDVTRFAARLRAQAFAVQLNKTSLTLAEKERLTLALLNIDGDEPTQRCVREWLNTGRLAPLPF